jgi:hypothetical protein
VGFRCRAFFVILDAYEEGVPVVVDLSESETNQILMSLQMLIHGLGAVEETKEITAAGHAATELFLRLNHQRVDEGRARSLAQRQFKLSQNTERKTQ